MTQAQIWVLEIDADLNQCYQKGHQVLGALEQAEIGMYQTIVDKGLASFSRIVPRVLASVFIDCSVLPHEWFFGRTVHGGRYLRGPSGLILNISLADTQKFIVISMSRSSDIGVDIDTISHDLNWRDITTRFFPPCDQKLFDDLPDSMGAQIFMMIWTAKEAFAKATGIKFANVLKKSLSGLTDNGQWSITWFRDDVNTLALCAHPNGLPFTLKKISAASVIALLP